MVEGWESYFWPILDSTKMGLLTSITLFKYEMQKIACLPTFTLSSNVFHSPVPDDIFSRNYVWKGFYNLKGKNQPMNLTVNNYNVSTGRVNATLINSNTEFLLSGNYGCFGNA